MEQNNYSFRDPVARVVNENGVYKRYIFADYKQEYDHLMNTGLFDELVKKKLLINHNEISECEKNITIYKKILPDQLEFQSYPFEWCFEQWKKALITYFQINLIALNYGMILKDATPYNFYFKNGKALLFDTTSFAFFKENDKWQAYRQLCEEFLGPFLLMYYSGNFWSKLTIASPRGLNLDFVSKNLPLKSWFSIVTLINIHIHSKYYLKKSAHKVNKVGFDNEKISRFNSILLNSIEKIKEKKTKKSKWKNYYKNDIESADYLTCKIKVINEWVDLIKPDSMVDLGANNGLFCFQNINKIKKIIAIESDETCVEKIENEISKKNISNIFCAKIDLSNPTPNFGVMNDEFKDIFLRAKSDLVLALAITHHLFISNYMSFKQITILLEKFSKRYVIVEFISKNDRRIEQLKLQSERNMIDYSEETFIQSLESKFSLIKKHNFNNSNRVLMLLELITSLSQ